MIEVAEAKRLSPLDRHRGAPGRGVLARPTATAPRSRWCSATPTAARRAGARLLRGTRGRRASSIDGQRSPRCGPTRGTIRTDDRRLRRRRVVRAIGAMAGVDLPVEPLRRQIAHHRADAGPRPATRRSRSTSRPASTSTARATACCSGMSDPDETPGFKLGRSDDWLPRLGEADRDAARPALAEVGIASGWAGLYEMTPDHNALIGEADEVSPVPLRHRLLRPRLPDGPRRRRGGARPRTSGTSPSWTSAALDVRRFADSGVPARAQHRLTRRSHS